MVAKTADYTVTPPLDHAGAVFTNAGATGVVTFTLPQPTRAVLGWWYRFRAVVGHNITVAAATPGTLITGGSTTSDSMTIAGTAPAQINGEIEAFCVETAPNTYAWCASPVVAHDGQTYTVP